jgi:hypothetical protein
VSEKVAFESWAIVEVMGHMRFAGLVTEQTIGGASFIRIDVPELKSEAGETQREAFTKIFGASAIYSITPCTEGTARMASKQSSTPPMSDWDVQAVMRRLELSKARPTTVPQGDRNYDAEDDEDDERQF